MWITHSHCFFIGCWAWGQQSKWLWREGECKVGESKDKWNMQGGSGTCANLSLPPSLHPHFAGDIQEKLSPQRWAPEPGIKENEGSYPGQGEAECLDTAAQVVCPNLRLEKPKGIMETGGAVRSTAAPQQSSKPADQRQYAWAETEHSTLHQPSKHKKNMVILYISNDAQNVFCGPFHPGTMQ